MLHDVLDGSGGAACAMTDYVLCKKVYGAKPDGAAGLYTPGSDCAGAVAEMVKGFEYSGALYDLSWILAGAMWFREALHLRGCIVDLASNAPGGRLAADDW
ncbi:MAG: hypothetical protein ACRDR6_03020 [Pseudonocardiaceae bacterium]